MAYVFFCSVTTHNIEMKLESGGEVGRGARGRGREVGGGGGRGGKGGGTGG